MEDELRPRKPYPTDVPDKEWALVAPYLTLMTPDAPPRCHDLREVCDAPRWMGRTGAPERMLSTTLPPWEAVYQKTRRCLAAGCFEAMAHDLPRVPLRGLDGRADPPTAVIFDRATRQSSPESGGRAGDDGH